MPPQDRNEFTDLFRRMQAPHYEEARRPFECGVVTDEYYDAGGDFVHRRDVLARIANHDGECNHD